MLAQARNYQIHLSKVYLQYGPNHPTLELKDTNKAATSRPLREGTAQQTPLKRAHIVSLVCQPAETLRTQPTPSDATLLDRDFMHTLLHCASAYPDPIAPETSASSLLLELAHAKNPHIAHKIYSFKRASPKADTRVVIPFDDPAGQDHRAIAYGAYPKGLRFAHFLDGLADWIISDATARSLKPDMVHAHKVSLDGLVGARVAAHFDVPLMMTIQANTDENILKVKKNLRPRYKGMWKTAAAVFEFAPNASAALTPYLGPRDVTLLPCPTRADHITSPVVSAAPVIRTAFNMAFYKNKNIETLVRAIKIASVEIPDISLEIIGGGDKTAFLTVAQMVDQIAPDRVRLLGARPQAKMQNLLHTATAFALLSRRESYGMVFAESLLAGTPCLHPSDRAIDGLFPDGEITLKADPRDEQAIATALIRLCREEAAFKARIKTLQDTGGLAILQQDHIAQTYLDTVQSVLEPA